MDLPPPPSGLQDLLDRAAIHDVKQCYAFAVDRRDWPLYRSIFTDEVAFDFFDWAGIRETIAADRWVEMVKATLGPFDATQHVFSGQLVSLRGDEAEAVTTMTARHQLGTEAQLMGGYYTERFVRTPAGWKIAACRLNITWEEGDRSLFEKAAALGARARTDIGLQGA